jgi:predicted metal-binding membrane protein
MTASEAPLEHPVLRLTLRNVVMLCVAVLAWAAVIAYARDMGNETGTMGLSGGEFIAMWSLMMTAMMLPAVVPVASLYALTIMSNRARRLTVFVAGYLIIWSVVGVPVYGALRVVDRHFADSATTMRFVSAAILAAAGLYQLTPIKAVCLRHCRSPLGQLLRYGSVKGPGRDLKVALHHAGFCLGCCWALMALFVGVGAMSLGWAVGIALVVLVEKVRPEGVTFGRIAGALLIVAALIVFAFPDLAMSVGGSM